MELWYASGRFVVGWLKIRKVACKGVQIGESVESVKEVRRRDKMTVSLIPKTGSVRQVWMPSSASRTSALWYPTYNLSIFTKVKTISLGWLLIKALAWVKIIQCLR